MFLIEKYGMQLLLRLPEGMRKRIFADKRLDQDCKFVLATLYLLDSKGRLKDFAAELPRHTGMDWEKCRLCLQKLACARLIEYTRSQVSLRIKPLTYKDNYAKKR